MIDRQQKKQEEEEIKKKKRQYEIERNGWNIDVVFGVNLKCRRMDGHARVRTQNVRVRSESKVIAHK